MDFFGGVPFSENCFRVRDWGIPFLRGRRGKVDCFGGGFLFLVTVLVDRFGDRFYDRQLFLGKHSLGPVGTSQHYRMLTK